VLFLDELHARNEQADRANRDAAPPPEPEFLLTEASDTEEPDANSVAGEPIPGLLQALPIQEERDAEATYETPVAQPTGKLKTLFIPNEGFIKVLKRCRLNLPYDVKLVNIEPDPAGEGFTFTLSSEKFDLVEVGEPIPDLGRQYTGVW
jgi:hypothetical protein